MRSAGWVVEVTGWVRVSLTGVANDSFRLTLMEGGSLGFGLVLGGVV